MPFELPKLPYAYDALEPTIDAETVTIHHDRHHATYVANFNKALEGQPELANKSVEEILTNLDKVPESIRNAIRNHGGGHLNHTFYWEVIGPNAGGEPKGDLAAAIKTTFGDFASFKEKFTAAGLGQFGSGWAWLVLDAGKLAITSTSNQITPLSEGKTPLLTLDVWEHAYYLKYQNKRADHIAAWWNIVNWAKVAEIYDQAKR
jgi:Fe-Mn family superoxide dismutase